MRNYQKFAKVLNGLQQDPNARCNYDLFADALVWSDEIPSPDPSVEVSISAELRGIWHYRTSLILGNPKEKFRLAWEEARRCFPNWPGFHPSRQDSALAAKFAAMQEESMNKWEYAEDCIDAELARKGLNV